MTFCECAVRCLCMQVLCRGGKTYRLSVVNFVECVVCGLCLLCVLAVRCCHGGIALLGLCL